MLAAMDESPNPVTEFKERSKRSQIPVRTAFVRSGLVKDVGEPPLAKLLRGGRGGRVRVATYLSLIWRCSAPPYSTNIKASAIARLWGLPSPDTNGARRVQEAFNALEEHHLVQIQRRPGRESTILLLDDAGTGREYQAPTVAYNYARRRKASGEALRHHNYFKLDVAWWESGTIQALKGPGLAMLLILLSEESPSRRGPGIWISPSNFKERYGLSVDTRKVGLKELQDARIVIPTTALQEDFFSQNRRRVFYQLQDPALRLPKSNAWPPVPPGGGTEDIF